MTQLNQRIPTFLKRTAAVAAAVVCLSPLRVAAQEYYSNPQEYYSNPQEYDDSPEYSSINIFGDSLVDAGNFFNLTQLPPSQPYNQKFSNGSVWVEPLADELALSPTLFTELTPNMQPSEGINFALAGSFSSNQNVTEDLFGLQQQIDSFVPYASALTSDANALFVILAGGNDYNGAVADPEAAATLDALPDQVTDNIIQAASDLIDLGAKHLLVANLPDLAQQPFTQQLAQLNPQSAELLTSLSAQHNQLLGQKLAALSAASDVKITQLDLDGLFEVVLANPTKFGFANTEEACLTNFQSGFVFEGVCDDPDEFVFWDDVHPTDATSQLIAELAIDTLEVEDSVEESAPTPYDPYSAVPLILVGGGGLACTKALQRKKAGL